MADIDIRREHSLEHDAAKKAAEDVARRLNNEFDLKYAWRGDCIVFQRSGVQGQMEVAASHVHVQARLGLALKIEGQVAHADVTGGV